MCGLCAEPDAWLDPSIEIPRVVYRRLEMLVEEVWYFEHSEESELTCDELRERTHSMAGRIVDEYVRQHFEELTRVAAHLLTARRRKMLR